MGRVRDLITRSLLGSWGLTRSDMLENEFDLTTRNVGGSHSEGLTNRHENRKHTKHFTIIPTYDSKHDPHLEAFYRNRLRARTRQRRRKASADGAAAEVDTAERKVDDAPSHFSSTRSEVCPPSHIVSTEQVLALKRMFYRYCKDAGPPDQPDADELPSAPRTVRRLENAHVLPLYQRGVEITNHHRKLHKLTEMKPVLLKKLLVVLAALTTEVGLDWNTFLLLVTVNLGRDRDYKQLLVLKDAHERYLQYHRVDSEQTFFEMLLHLNGGMFINSNSDQMTSFFQNGDFYQARGSWTSFAEAVFSMYEHVTQLYIARARGRGPRLNQNFCGHSTPGNVGGTPGHGYEKRYPLANNEDGRWACINTYWVP
eukprot:TRINITY_DN16668_c0_g1_i1.p2 TRINITY_DN16668_c0_g1~~TRINITY_DN16668_c0_g1_i1.p2  ORF type:complete len:369 (+),score=79.14 TRINITY_DN16668_c0_g1_i1:58-1164(+)